MICRGHSLSVQANPIVAWKFGDSHEFVCGEESERHVIMECALSKEWQVPWLRKWREEREECAPLSRGH